jgi:hypothetical protein
MSDTKTFMTATTGHHTDDDGNLFEWRLQDVAGHRALHVSRHGGRTLVWSEGETIPPGPPETRLAAFEIALHIGMVGRPGRFVSVETNDFSSGKQMVVVLDTAAPVPSETQVCTTSRQWATTIARALNAAKHPEPEDVPF